MPRQNRRQEMPERPFGASGAQRSEVFGGASYVVRSIAAGTADEQRRAYRCPGCDQEIAGIAHVVAWPAADLDGTHRRHWHTPCWQARENRRASVRRHR